MSLVHWIKRNANVLFFIGGFIFDTFTMVRIDSTLDLLWQFVYMGVITVIMIAQIRLVQGRWTPTGRIAKYWAHETEALHFCYGGLLSGFIIFYFKSTSFSRSLVFLTLIAILMIGNEMPQLRKLGTHMRLGLYAFCVVSYLNYLLPVLIGRMGMLIFILGWTLACMVVYLVMKTLARTSEDPPAAMKKFSTSPALVLILILALYTFKLIPPVPLSLRHLGIYRSVERVGNRYHLISRQPPWIRFWETDEWVFPARPGDEIYTFVSVFGPSRFSHQICVRWSLWNPVRKEWMTSDKIPMALTGGRKDGFRGSMMKQNYSPGLWRVEVETEDERVLGSRTFRVQEDLSTGERSMTETWR